MSFLRRLLGGSNQEQPADAAPAGGAPAGADPAGAAPPDEAAYERELLLGEAKRLDDDFIQRQMRFADKSWTPPAQGGTRRADDTADE